MTQGHAPHPRRSHRGPDAMGTPPGRMASAACLVPARPRGSRLGQRLRPAMGRVSVPAKRRSTHMTNPIRRHPPPAADRRERGGARRGGLRRQSRPPPRRPPATPACRGDGRAAVRRRQPRAPPTGEIDLFNTDYAPDRRHRRRHRDRRRLAGGDPVQPVLPDPGHRGQRRVRDVGDPRRRSPTTTSTRPTSRPRSRPSTTAASRSRATTATR